MVVGWRDRLFRSVLEVVQDPSASERSLHTPRPDASDPRGLVLAF